MQKTVNILRPNFKQIKSVVQPVLDKPFLSKIDKAININDLRNIAKTRVHPMVFAYLDGALMMKLHCGEVHNHLNQ